MRIWFNWSTDTITNYKNWFLQLCIDEVQCYGMEQIGGAGVDVEIDESKFGKRKYHKGHRVKGAWVFGGVEKNTERKNVCSCFPQLYKGHPHPTDQAIHQTR